MYSGVDTRPIGFTYTIVRSFTYLNDKNFTRREAHDKAARSIFIFIIVLFLPLRTAMISFQHSKHRVTKLGEEVAVGIQDLRRSLTFLGTFSIWPIFTDAYISIKVLKHNTSCLLGNLVFGGIFCTS